MKWRRIRQWTVVGICLAVPGLLISAWLVAGSLLAPANRVIGEPPKDLPVVSATIDSESGSRIAAWCIPAEESEATVILLHGIRGDRRSMLGRAKLLHQAGYSVVLIDLQAHGESPGAQITIGHLEQHDVRAAVSYVRMMQPNHRIGVIGVSLGGAAALLGSPLDVDALVLESVYPTITDAVHNRVAAQVGPLSYVLSPLLLCQLQPRLGISTRDLRPIDKMADVACPLLVASGDVDRHTTIAETQLMFESAIEPKQLVIFKGAAHIDLLNHDRQKYKEEILGFLETYLRSSPRK
jgi:fermentation-respiration switch protein FrsA (DUF1100 family)